jgi:hypothetical protein
MDKPSTIIGFAFAAFCLWLTMRIFNRREKWAMQIAGLVGLWVLVAAAIFALFAVYGIFSMLVNGIG